MSIVQGEARKLPASSESYSKLKDNIHSYVSNFVYFLANTASSEMQKTFLQMLRRSSLEYIACFPVIAKKLLKVMCILVVT